MFEYELGARVRIIDSGDSGKVTARTDNVDASNQFHVEYLGADGVARSDWFFGSRLIPYQDGMQGPDPMAGVEMKSTDGDGAAKSPDPTAGGEIDRSVAAEVQEVEDGTN